MPVTPIIKRAEPLELEALCQLNFDLFISEKKYLEAKKFLAYFAREQEKLGGKKYQVFEAQLMQDPKSELYTAPDIVGDLATEKLADAESAAGLGESAIVGSLDADPGPYYDKCAYEQKRESPLEQSYELVPITWSGSDLCVTNPHAARQGRPKAEARSPR